MCFQLRPLRRMKQPVYTLLLAGLLFLLAVQVHQSSRKQAELDRLLAAQQQQLVEFKPARVIDEASLAFFRRVQRRRYALDWRAVVEWNETAVHTAQRLLYQLKAEDKAVPLLPEANFVFPASMCAYFRQVRAYDTRPLTDFELRFPIAFSILTYDNAEQFERLLRAIYRPHNLYCVQYVPFPFPTSTC